MKSFFRASGVLFLLLALGLGCDSVTPIAPADAILTITVNPTRIESQGEATITVLARKTDGFPVNEGTEITFSTDLGRIDPEVTFTDEQGRASTTLFGNGEVGLATVTAVSGSIEITAETAVRIGSIPNSLVFEVIPAEVNLRDIDIERVFRLSASVTDDLGANLKDATVRFESDIGKLESRNNPVLTNNNGVARDKLTVKKTQLANAGGSFFVTAVVTGGDEEGFVELIADEEVFIFGNPFDIFLETSQSSVPVEGAAIDLIATVFDDLSEPLAGAKVRFESSAGRVASLGGVVRTDENGQAFDFLEITETDLASLGNVNTITVTAQILGQGGADGAVIDSDIETLTVQGRPPIASFNFVADCGDVTFTNTSTPVPTVEVPVEFVWDFGDGTGLTITETAAPAPVSNSYTVSPPYPTTPAIMVSLTATNIFGTNNATLPLVFDPTPISLFTFAPGTTVPTNYTFTATAVTNNLPVVYDWDFSYSGNPATFMVNASGQSVVRTLVSPSTQTVALRVTACDGLSAEVSTISSQTVSVP